MAQEDFGVCIIKIPQVLWRRLSGQYAYEMASSLLWSSVPNTASTLLAMYGDEEGIEEGQCKVYFECTQYTWSQVQADSANLFQTYQEWTPNPIFPLTAAPEAPTLLASVVDGLEQVGPWALRLRKFLKTRADVAKYAQHVAKWQAQQPGVAVQAIVRPGGIQHIYARD